MDFEVSCTHTNSEINLNLSCNKFSEPTHLNKVRTSADVKDVVYVKLKKQWCAMKALWIPIKNYISLADPL